MADEAERLEAQLRTSASGEGYGLTPVGFVPKPFGRLLDEKLAAARVLFGDDLDLTSGSVLRKILELVAMEEARSWEHLGRLYDDGFVSRATGEALSLLGAELGVPRPHRRARGNVRLTLVVELPDDVPQLVLPLGTRLLTPGGHDYFIAARVVLTNQARTTEVQVVAFNPGPEQNLDPSLEIDGEFPQRLDRFNLADGRSAFLRALAADLGGEVIEVTHSAVTAGGEEYLDDDRYRDLLLSYPRNVWSPETLRLTVARVPGVRQVQVKDKYGGLDIGHAIFGNFSFVERLFTEERNLGSPFFITILVAPDVGAIWEGPGQLRERIATAVEQVRPIGIHPNLEPVTEVGVGFQAQITVEGLSLTAGVQPTIDQTPEATALKHRILARARRYVNALGIGEPVRYSEILWTIMEEPGVVDCKFLRLRRYPPRLAGVDLAEELPTGPDLFGPEEDIAQSATEIAVLVEDPAPIVVV